uniref:Uncharacterized protein n=1 Tax=Anopheles farauti TaxID=69004 RepID=A0A182QE65_9DIPT
MQTKILHTNIRTPSSRVVQNGVPVAYGCGSRPGCRANFMASPMSVRRVTVASEHTLPTFTPQSSADTLDNVRFKHSSCNSSSNPGAHNFLINPRPILAQFRAPFPERKKFAIASANEDTARVRRSAKLKQN